jgi:adenylate cyclase class 1
LLREQGGAGYTMQPLDPPRSAGGSLQVQAIAEHGPARGQVLYTVWCDGVAFSERELGPRFRDALATHIRTRRADHSDYPVYLTDLDLSAIEAAEPAPFQTVQYLRHRQQLEATLNATGTTPAR